MLTTATKKTVLGSFLTLFIFSNAVIGIDLTPEIRHDAKTEILASALVSSSHSLLPNGFHESSSLEIQRLEYNLLRHALPRFSAQRVWFWYADTLDGSSDATVLLRFNTVLVDAARYSLSHAHLDVRYPIPPPSV